ncbi:MAG: HD domain-containing protein [Candidatus Aenigmarchaeota archaeon]|nr:HD domain-containing protein [Candidatus Aenigmarchaeota archaeon]
MNKDHIIQEIEKRVKEQCSKDTSGHDFSHTNRVRRNAIKIAKIEGGDLFVIELAALLHDVEDWKTGNYKTGVVAKWVDEIGVDDITKEKVNTIISKISFKGVNHDDKMDTIEGKVVQDADRLDALGAIGIIRSVQYGAANQITYHDPLIKPDPNPPKEKIKKSTSINHFYEKLLLLKDRMNTETAKKMAKKRHEFMELFLKEFFKEWEI